MSEKLFYKVYVPEIREINREYSVIYLMHGMGSNELNMISLLNEVKEEFIIITIRGGIITGNGFAYFDILGYGKPDKESFNNAVNSIEDLINETMDKYPMNKDKLFLMGFSQGAILSMALALKMGNKINGIIALSGYIPKIVTEDYEIKDVSKLKAFISHGKFDNIFNIEIGEKNKEFFEDRNSEVVYKVYKSDHEVSIENNRDLIRWINNNK